MAARRLIIILVVLFALSTLAAALAPVRGPQPTTLSTSTAVTPPPTPGSLVVRGIAASVRAPETVRADVGDQLELDVRSTVPRQIEIPPRGLLEDAAALAPAHFSLLLDAPGAMPVTDATTGEIVGRILVRRSAGAAASDR